MNQLIYRQEYSVPFDLSDMGGCRFVPCWSGIDAIKYVTLLIRHRGILGFLKDAVKLITPSRSYFYITDGEKIVSEVYVTVGQCRHYGVEKNAAVLGPVWTDANTRGKGLATDLLKRTINSLLEKGCRIIYIDTSENNVAMQNVIEKCGFGDIVDKYEKK